MRIGMLLLLLHRMCAVRAHSTPALCWIVRKAHSTRTNNAAGRGLAVPSVHGAGRRWGIVIPRGRAKHAGCRLGVGGVGRGGVRRIGGKAACRAVVGGLV